MKDMRPNYQRAYVEAERQRLEDQDWYGLYEAVGFAHTEPHGHSLEGAAAQAEIARREQLDRDRQATARAFAASEARLNAGFAAIQAREAAERHRVAMEQWRRRVAVRAQERALHESIHDGVLTMLGY
jgi:hypothetical protein